MKAKRKRHDIEFNSDISSLSRRESREGRWGKAGFEYNVEQYACILLISAKAGTNAAAIGIPGFRSREG